MSVRSLERLRADQAAILDAHRRREAALPGAAVPAAAALDQVTTIGQVTTVVTSDPTYGAHLVVQPQAFSGTPPSPGAAAQATVRAYPTPNRVVGDYSVNEYVSLLVTRGALLAVKLG